MKRSAACDRREAVNQEHFARVAVAHRLLELQAAEGDGRGEPDIDAIDEFAITGGTLIL